MIAARSTTRTGSRKAAVADLRKLIINPRANLGVICLRQGLRLIGLPYRSIVALRNVLFDCGLKKTFRSRLPVVSVGNLSVGGTGKTPTVAWLSRWFRNHDIRVAILSRGYGQLDHGQNDEALELELQLPDVPHLQHWDRIASARLADEELEMQLLLLDDGFQHRRLARDLDIVLIDASEPISALRLLPGGLLREPFSSLRRAHAVILTRSDQAEPLALANLKQRVRRANPKLSVAIASHRPTRVEVFPAEHHSLESLKGKSALAFCAIGNPNSFFATLAGLGLKLIDQRTWPDHHAYSADDIQNLVQWTSMHPEADWILCTRKDWVKLQMQRVGTKMLGALLVELEFTEGQPELEQQLSQLLEENSLMSQTKVW